MIFSKKKSRQGKGYRLFFLKNSTKSSKKIAKNRKFVAVPEDTATKKNVFPIFVKSRVHFWSKSAEVKMAKTIQKTRFFLKFRGFPEVLEGRIFPISLALSRFFPKILGLETLFFINLDFLGSRDPRILIQKPDFTGLDKKIF